MNALAEAEPEPQAASPSQVTTEEPAAAVAVLPLPAAVRPAPIVTLPGGRAPDAPLMARVQAMGNFALAKLSYRVRRLGGATIVGVLAIATAATIYLASNLPQGAVITALKSQLRSQAPAPKGARIAMPAAMLAALPARAEAPTVVSKILEEARAAGVELPRGQYEYVPARDGMAARYRMTFPVRASYPRIRTFMDRTLVALPAVAVEGLRIERKSVGDDSVEAELKLAAYVRSDP